MYKICNHAYYDIDLDPDEFVLPLNAVFFNDNDICICGICGKIMTDEESNKRFKYLMRANTALQYIDYILDLEIEFLLFTQNKFKTDLTAFNVLHYGHLEYETIEQYGQDKLINEFVINGYINCDEIKDNFESFCYNNPIKDE